MRGSRRTHVVFVGEGHASLYALVRAAELAARGCAVTLVSPAPFAYSGIAAATLGGRYTPESPFIDAGKVVAGAGGRVVRRRVVSIDPSARTVLLDDGNRIAWDRLVLDAGSEVDREALPGSEHRAFPVKPFDALLRYREALLEGFGGAPLRVTIIGGGPSACEVAANTLALAERAAATVEVTLITAADRLVEHMPATVAGALHRHLQGRGVRIITRLPVVAVEEKATVDGHGGRIPFDLLVDATGLRPVALAAASGLPSVAGALRVDRHLRAVDDARILGGGDGVRIEGHEHVRPVGVHAVRQGPILFHNLLASLDGGRLRSFRPQRHYLLILDLGGTALATRNGLYWLGPAARRLKDRIDGTFLRRHGGDPRRLD